MRKISDVQPKWVLVNEELHNVSGFADIVPKKRPAAFCPVCQKPVILKLGKKRTHHYAHQPEDVCIVTQPETALHLNTKLHIYKQLLSAKVLFIEQSCSRFSCKRKNNLLWLSEWDDIQVEYSVNTFRPDISILFNGNVIGAIEVFVTHSVEEQKEQFFKEQNISWLELRATEALYEGSHTWTPEKPLSFYRIYPPIERWTCDECQEAHRKRKEQLEYQRNNYETVHAAKMVDFYFRSGKKYREVYFVMKKVVNQEWVKAWIKTEDGTVIAAEKGPITKESLKKLNYVVQKRIEDFRKKGAIVDEFMTWQLWVKGNKFVARATDKFPFRYYWDDRIDEWKLDK